MFMTTVIQLHHLSEREGERERDRERELVGCLRPGRPLVQRLTMFTIAFLFPKKSILLINTLTKHAMLHFFIILPEQQGYRDNSCWLPPFPLQRVLSAILKKSRHKQSSARSFPVVSDFFFHVISGCFRSFPVLRDTRHLYCCSADKHSPTYNVHIVEYNGREVISRIYLS